MSFWVYMLGCADGSYYTGHTDDLERRVAQHQSGDIPGCYTLKRRPLKLVFAQEFPDRESALASEQQVKRWSRAKKEALIAGDWTRMKALARCRNESVHGSTGSPRTDFSAPTSPCETSHPDETSPPGQDILPPFVVSEVEP